ncbi:MAG: LysE family translocator [Marinomonas sp.]|jgi:homoserine/homoserine lactone efflux protein|uniref:Threonine/homoserine/homoserine lactone efflux protein n=1 Tax=Marinomonas communis TaxID=28254 RepID=A0A4R6XDN6_9GAMM|nr:LysE family translocator [Marinomonas communis]MEC8482639.1 LysE family translocator [Pseudomonadota bacterium]RUM50996.1 MAG: LysE family translocator [Marinomonas sp.]MCC4272841.1 LysE family translocator [Marinomonas communis]RUM57101.1 MAG: LysE family translocator [Marinomonas sp.]TDR15840.1 threonine/homoserine/homoserine lactone efflux protein [Marinomonas communis]
MSLALLSVFVPTFFFVSITPGMCMTLAMTLGMTIGVKRSLWMMLGELTGVGLVALLSSIGVAALLLNYPTFFVLFKYVGGAYLAYLGVQMWLSRGKMAIKTEENTRPASVFELISQGFVTAIANPKGWAFFVALLPPFLQADEPLGQQLFSLITVILALEFCCLLIYASGGRTLRSLLLKSGNVRIMNRIAGSLMLGVGIWLAFG